jgi:hypothetical protein
MKRPRSIVVASLLFLGLVLALGACTQSVSLAVLAFTSPANNQRVTGSRTVTVTGTLTGTVTSLTATLNGSALAGLTHTSTGFSFPVTLADRANVIIVTATNSAGSTSATLNLDYPFLSFTTAQAAGRVIGQPDFTTSTSSLDAAHVAFPVGAATIANGTLYLSDYGDNRVLGYNAVPMSNGASADFVLGQPNFVTNASAPITAASLHNPLGLLFAAGKLFVADESNQRVLIFNTPPTATATAADVVIGQSSMTVSGSACTAAGFGQPASMAVAGTKLIVTDPGGNRVLIYNSVPTSNGAAADVVLGQINMTSCSANGGAVNPTASTLSFPSGVWTDGTRLLVADAHNNRVLVWNTVPTSNGAPADVVIGQGSMTTAASGLSTTQLTSPFFLTSNDNQLFVSDSFNNRVLVYNSIPTSNGAAADAVLGQTDFTSNGTGTTATTLANPLGLYVTDTMLFVDDSNNNRVLGFQP